MSSRKDIFEVRYAWPILVASYFGLSIFMYNLYYIVSFGETTFRPVESGGWDYRILIFPAVVMVILSVYLVHIFSFTINVNDSAIKITTYYGLIVKYYKLNDITKIDDKSGEYSNGLGITFRDGFKILITSYASGFKDLHEFLLRDLS